MTTEFLQPARPMRIYTDSSKMVITRHVFAIAISNNHDLEYLTIDGHFVQGSSVLYAETLIDGVWHHIDSRAKREVQ